MEYKIHKDDVEYQMGVSIDEVGKGDVVKVGSGSLEVITSIKPIPGSWDKTITTESGEVFGMMDIHEYGKREDPEK